MTPKQGWVLALATVGSFMVALDVLVVTTALSAIRLHLGAGLSVAMPAALKSIVGAVDIDEIGKASGAAATLRFFGAVFGIAILAVVFASLGSFASPLAFTGGFAPAIGVAAALALVGAIAGLGIPSRQSNHLPRRSS